MTNCTYIRKIDDKQAKARITRAILEALPDWFGIAESREEYIAQSEHMPFWAYGEEGDERGFIALKETSPYTAEICVMGVLAQYHRSGIGRALFEALKAYAVLQGYEYLQVKTVAAGHYEEYDRTRLFYEALGFRALEVFPSLWDEWNPCLVMVMKL